jgi:hypothetical protein
MKIAIIQNFENIDISYGICSDFIENYKKY